MNEDRKTGRSPVPAQAAEDVQEGVTEARKYSGGNARLDAEVEIKERMAADPALEQPIATNFSEGDSDPSDPADAENFTTTGAYPADEKRLEKDYSTPKIGSHGEAST